MMSVDYSQGQFEAEWRRSYGVHEFGLLDGSIVTVVSQPNWYSCYESLHSLRDLGNTTVLTPELITTPGPLEEIPNMESEVLRRTLAVRRISAQHQGATFLLGTAAFSDALFNSLMVIRDSLKIKEIHKVFNDDSPESMVFQSGTTEREPITEDGSVSALICSELLRAFHQRLGIVNDKPRLVKECVTTLMVSSCWAIPVVDLGADKVSRNRLTDETRYGVPLKAYIGGLFRTYSNLQEIVIADRAIASSEVSGPFNGHFRRSSSDK